MRRKASHEGYVSKYYTVRPLGLVAYDMGVPVHTLKEMIARGAVRRFKEDGGPMVVGDKLKRAVDKVRR